MIAQTVKFNFFSLSSRLLICDLPGQALGRRSKALTALLRQRYSESLLRDEAVFAAYLTQVRLTLNTCRLSNSFCHMYVSAFHGFMFD